MKNTALILFVCLAIVAAGVWVVRTQKKDSAPGPLGCTTEAKVCPDGTAVARSGPHCEFAACPAVVRPETEATSAALNERIFTHGIHITPLSVVGDSRCPVDVNCIQAGTVRLSVKLESGTSTQTQVLTIGSKVGFGGKSVALSAVTPAAHTKTPIVPTDYRFEFLVDFY